MTKEDFYNCQEELLLRVPQHFRAHVRDWAWDRDHATGYDAVIETIADIIDELILPSLRDAKHPTITASTCTECDGTGEITHGVRRGYGWIEPSGIDQCPECGSGEEMPI